MKMRILNKRESAGFSLLELLIVIIIIGILIVMATAQYSKFRSSVAANGFAQAIATKVREGALTARALGKVVTMKIDLTNEQVWLEVDNKKHGSTLSSPSANVDIAGIELSAGNFPSAGTYSVVFNPRGTAMFTGSSALTPVAIHVRQDKSVSYAAGADSNKFRTVVVIQNTARVELYKKGIMDISTDATNWSWPYYMDI